MQIWIDAQLPPSLAQWINQNFNGIEAIALKGLGLRDATDHEIFMAAKAKNVIVMSNDSDFNHMLQVFGPPPQIIWVTAGNTSNIRMQEILHRHLARVIDLLQKGEKIVEISGQ
jgi:predicted nuclease of predicted toxin-antitoxin system